MIIAFIICTCVALLYVVIGITTRRSKTPSGFFTFVDAPDVKDVKNYNRAVSRIWFVGAVILELVAALPMLFLKQNSPLVMICVFGVAFLTIFMCIAYLYTERKYRD